MRKGFTLIELMIVIAIIAIIAAIAIPNLLESRVTANEAAASASLKSGIFPAQVQFQGGGYQDVDADNVGEFGTLGALGGRIATSKIAAGSIRLLQGPIATSAPQAGGTTAAPASATSSGYRFTSYVPSETNGSDVTQVLWPEGGAAPTALVTTTNTCNNGERYWVAGCIPDKFGDTGRRPFIIGSDGLVRSPATTAGLLAYYTATPANGMTSAPADFAKGIAHSVTGTATVSLTMLDAGITPSAAPPFSK